MDGDSGRLGLPDPVLTVLTSSKVVAMFTARVGIWREVLGDDPGGGGANGLFRGFQARCVDAGGPEGIAVQKVEAHPPRGQTPEVLAGEGINGELKAVFGGIAVGRGPGFVVNHFHLARAQVFDPVDDAFKAIAIQLQTEPFFQFQRAAEGALVGLPILMCKFQRPGALVDGVVGVEDADAEPAVFKDGVQVVNAGGQVVTDPDEEIRYDVMDDGACKKPRMVGRADLLYIAQVIGPRAEIEKAELCVTESQGTILMRPGMMFGRGSSDN